MSMVMAANEIIEVTTYVALTGRGDRIRRATYALSGDVDADAKDIGQAVYTALVDGARKVEVKHNNVS